jgi:hypothetical protein
VPGVRKFVPVEFIPETENGTPATTLSLHSIVPAI